MDDLLTQALDAVANDPRPLIQLRAGGLPEAVMEAEAALAGLGTVYQRGGMLVRVAALPTAISRPGGFRAAGSLVITPLDLAYTRMVLGRAARWEAFDGRKKGGGDWKPADVPSPVAASLLSAVGEWHNVPTLAGIIEAPTLRHDGSVLDRPGYDPESCLLFEPGPVEFAPVSRDPTYTEAQASLDQLLNILQGFPFLDEAARAAAVSELLTVLVRRTLRSAPLYVNTAPKMASGKSLLATVASYLATGRAPAMMSQADNKAEANKRFLAILIEGPALAVIDNVERPLQSDALCSILTEPEFSDRVLGISKTVRVPTNVAWIATGNNVEVEGDLTSRSIMVTIDPGIERPEEREFAVDLHIAVPERRGDLASAALTVIRGYLAAGAPEQKLPSFGRFEEWQRWCRYPLTWLGMADPCATRSLAESRDSVRGTLGDLLSAWHAAFGENNKTVQEAVKAAFDTSDSNLVPEDQRQALYDILKLIAGERGEINARRLGKFIAKHERRIEGSIRFERSGVGEKVIRWRATRGFESLGSLPQPYAGESDSCISDGSTDPNSRNSPNRLSAGVVDGDGVGAPPEWTNDEAWLGRIARGRRSDDRVSVLGEWASVAGGCLTTSGETLVLELPRRLPKGMALTGLQQAAAELHVPIRLTGTVF